MLILYSPSRRREGLCNVQGPTRRRGPSTPSTTAAFLSALFGEVADEAFVVAFKGDPADGNWGGGPVWGYGPRHLDPEANNYFCVSLFDRGPDGAVRRTQDLWRALHVVMVDDVGTKVPPPTERGFGEPTAIIETSPGNSQWIYALDEPETDRFRAATLIARITDPKTPIGDPGAGDLNRVARLPVGVNGKPAYAKGGKAPRVSLLEFEPERRYGADEIAAWMGSELPPAGAFDGFGECAEAAPIEEVLASPVVAAWQASGHRVSDRLNARGWLEVQCLWEGEHTSGKNGSALLVREDGTWAFKCQHGHCAHRGAREAWRRLLELGAELGPPGGDPFAGIELDGVLESPSDEGAAMGEVKDQSRQGRIDLADFYFLTGENKPIFRPTGGLWVRAGVDASLPKVTVKGSDGKPKDIGASAWLAQHAAVQGMTWDPSEPELIKGKLYAEGSVVARRGALVFNLYRAPVPLPGRADRAGPWLDHTRAVLPDDCERVFDFLASTVQFPGVKINHALVLTGPPGVGKDTIFEPVVRYLGPANVGDIAPHDLFGTFNDDFTRKVFVRINEARDAAEFDRFQFYERTKVLFAAPPTMLRVNPKFIPAFYAPNVIKGAITSNSRETALYLPAEDRRHDVMTTPLPFGHFAPAYFRGLYGWFDAGGVGHVIAWLMARDLSRFDPKAPPHHGPAFWAIVNANRAPDDSAMEDLVGLLLDDNGGKLPEAVTFDSMFALLRKHPDRDLGGEIAGLLRSLVGPRRASATLRMKEIGYEVAFNPSNKEGRWQIGQRKLIIYALKTLSPRDRLAAAEGFRATAFTGG